MTFCLSLPPPNQVFSGNIEVQPSFVSSFALYKKKNLFELQKHFKTMFKNPPNNNPQNPPVFCNIKRSVPAQELPAPSGTPGRGQLPGQHSSRAQEDQDEPGPFFLYVPGKAGVQPGKLQRGSFLSLCCCHAGRYLKPGRGWGGEKKKEKKGLSMLSTRYLYSDQTQFARMVFRAVVYGIRTAEADTPLIQSF